LSGFQKEIRGGLLTADIAPSSDDIELVGNAQTVDHIGCVAAGGDQRDFESCRARLF
jgi:hypothetical protein